MKAISYLKIRLWKNAASPQYCNGDRPRRPGTYLMQQVFERSCTCKHPRIQKTWTKAVLGATFGLQSIHTHRRGCPLFRDEDEITKISFDISLISRLVNKAARLSLSLQYGACGMSVSPYTPRHERAQLASFCITEDSRSTRRIS